MDRSKFCEDNLSPIMRAGQTFPSRSGFKCTSGALCAPASHPSVFPFLTFLHCSRHPNHPLANLEKSNFSAGSSFLSRWGIETYCTRAYHGQFEPYSSKPLLMEMVIIKMTILLMPIMMLLMIITMMMVMIIISGGRLGVACHHVAI